MDESLTLLPATVIRGKLCAEARLSKRAALLLRRECDAMGAALLQRASRARAARGGPLEARDIWEAVLSDEKDAWLASLLGIWMSPGSEAAPPAEVSLPYPPHGLTPDSDLLPPLVWLHGFPQGSAGAAPTPLPMHRAFLERADEPGASAVAVGGTRPLHPLLLIGRVAAARPHPTLQQLDAFGAKSH